VSVSEIGKVIQTEIEKRGFKPIANLCGHSLDRFNLHAGEEIPNVERGGYALQAGDVFAIEPFATTGKGWIRQGSVCEIYSLAKLGSVRLPQSRKLLSFIENEFFTLPFARRQLEEVASELALADLIQQGFLHEYPILVEEGKGFVSQAETSVIIEENGAKILV
jgi:methionyl aminopeptidase